MAHHITNNSSVMRGSLKKRR